MPEKIIKQNKKQDLERKKSIKIMTISAERKIFYKFVQNEI